MAITKLMGFRVHGEHMYQPCVLIALISLENLEVRDAGSSVIELNGSKSAAAKVATEGCRKTAISCNRDDLNLPQR
jgi:hypothetical protein